MKRIMLSSAIVLSMVSHPVMAGKLPVKSAVKPTVKSDSRASTPLPPLPSLGDLVGGKIQPGTPLPASRKHVVRSAGKGMSPIKLAKKNRRVSFTASAGVIFDARKPQKDAPETAIRAPRLKKVQVRLVEYALGRCEEANNQIKTLQAKLIAQAGEFQESLAAQLAQLQAESAAEKRDVERRAAELAQREADFVEKKVELERKKLADKEESERCELKRREAIEVMQQIQALQEESGRREALKKDILVLDALIEAQDEFLGQVEAAQKQQSRHERQTQLFANQLQSQAAELEKEKSAFHLQLQTAKEKLEREKLALQTEKEAFEHQKTEFDAYQQRAIEDEYARGLAAPEKEKAEKKQVGLIISQQRALRAKAKVLTDERDELSAAQAVFAESVHRREVALAHQESALAHQVQAIELRERVLEAAEISLLQQEIRLHGTDGDDLAAEGDLLCEKVKEQSATLKKWREGLDLKIQEIDRQIVRAGREQLLLLRTQKRDLQAQIKELKEIENTLNSHITEMEKQFGNMEITFNSACEKCKSEKEKLSFMLAKVKNFPNEQIETNNKLRSIISDAAAKGASIEAGVKEILFGKLSDHIIGENRSAALKCVSRMEEDARAASIESLNGLSLEFQKLGWGLITLVFGKITQADQAEFVETLNSLVPHMGDIQIGFTELMSNPAFTMKKLRAFVKEHVSVKAELRHSPRLIKENAETETEPEPLISGKKRVMRSVSFLTPGGEPMSSEKRPRGLRDGFRVEED